MIPVFSFQLEWVKALQNNLAGAFAPDATDRLTMPSSHGYWQWSLLKSP